MNTLETSVVHLKGVVKSFTSNRHGDIDAVEIETEKGAVKLSFPPHMAKSIMETIAVDQPITANYIEKTKPEKKAKT